MPASMSQRSLRGHVTAVEQSGPDRLAGLFPCPLEEIPEYISVVLLSEAGDDHRLRQLASQTRALKVRVSAALVGQCPMPVYAGVGPLPTHGLSPHPSHSSKVNGRTIVRWARFLSQSYTDNVGGLEMNDAAVAAYATVNGVPESLIESAIASSTEEEAATLQRVGRLQDFVSIRDPT